MPYAKRREPIFSKSSGTIDSWLIEVRFRRKNIAETATPTLMNVHSEEEFWAKSLRIEKPAAKPRQHISAEIVSKERFADAVEGRAHHPSASATRPNGRPTANTACQFANERTTAHAAGPDAEAKETAMVL